MEELDAEAAEEKGLIPCVLRIAVEAGTPSFDAGVCRAFRRESEHKVALVCQQEVLLPSGRLLDVTRAPRTTGPRRKRKRGEPGEPGEPPPPIVLHCRYAASD